MRVLPPTLCTIGSSNLSSTWKLADDIKTGRQLGQAAWPPRALRMEFLLVFRCNQLSVLSSSSIFQPLVLVQNCKCTGANWGCCERRTVEGRIVLETLMSNNCSIERFYFVVQVANLDILHLWRPAFAVPVHLHWKRNFQNDDAFQYGEFQCWRMKNICWLNDLKSCSLQRAV